MFGGVMVTPLQVLNILTKCRPMYYLHLLFQCFPFPLADILLVFTVTFRNLWLKNCKVALFNCFANTVTIELIRLNYTCQILLQLIGVPKITLLWSIKKYYLQNCLE